MILFPEEFREFLRLLNVNQVNYLIVGGYALGFHGYVRATGDLDVFVEVSEDNATHLEKAFKEFGFEQGVNKSLFLEKGKMLRIGYPPLRLEILTEITGVEFKEAYKNCDKIEFEGETIHFIGFQDLIKNKLATGRLKDRVDVEKLMKTKDFKK